MATATNEMAGFFASILANPDDQAPRLIFADWLDEHKQPKRAAFIRAHCALTNQMEGIRPRKRVYPKRIQDTMENVNTLFLQAFPKLAKYGVWFEDSGICVTLPQSRTLRYRLGCLERIACLMDGYPQSAARLFTAEPIAHVEILDRVPRELPNGNFWFCGEGVLLHDRAFIPPEVFKFLPRSRSSEIEAGTERFEVVRFKTLGAALESLSRASLYAGREVAGHPTHLGKVSRHRK